MVKISIILITILLGIVFYIFNLPPFERAALDINKFKALSLSDQINYLAREKASILELQEFVKKAYPEEPSEKHDLAHKLGELAIEQEGISGFGLCDSFFQYGCFHGAALAAVRIRGDDPNLAKDLWEGCKIRTLPGNCSHGLGHAIMIIENYDLLTAYQECKETLQNSDNIFWCQDGVSMENISRSMAPESLGNYGKDSDPYYPCNSIPKEFEMSCTRNHVGYLYYKLGSSKESLKFCNSFSRKTAEECSFALGSVIAGKYNDTTESIKECNIAAGLRQFCINGAVSFWSTSRQFEKAETMCNALSTEPQKVDCKRSVDGFRNPLNL